MEEPEKEQTEPRQKRKISILSDKGNEQLFKIAFRNYIDLIGLADRKAGLLIQVNSIIISIVFGFIIKKEEVSYSEYIPTGIILIGSLITIFFSVLASKPRAKSIAVNTSDREQFFFGSFDRLDPYFKNVSWEKYANDITGFFKGDKKLVFEELIKESFDVRKVLSKKFVYLSIAYKVFFSGLLMGLLSFMALIIFKYKM